MSVLLVAVLVVAAALGAGVVRLGTVAADRARLAGSADLVALAAVTGGDGAASAVARANGVAIVGLRRSGTVVEVEVADGSGTAGAAARPAGQHGARPGRR